MSTNQDCVNARLIRFEYGSVAELPSYISFPTPYYLSLVFMKGRIEMPSIFPVRTVTFDSSYLQYLGKVVERVEEGNSLTYYFTDGSNISFSYA